jgi:hypothetical protein
MKDCLLCMMRMALTVASSEQISACRPSSPPTTNLQHQHDFVRMAAANAYIIITISIQCSNECCSSSSEATSHAKRTLLVLACNPA